MENAILTILAICGGIATIGGAWTAITKWIAPAVKISKRVSTIEHKQANDYESIKDIKETNQLLCKGMLCLMENAVTGNNIDRIKETKQEIQDYLIKR